jgi:hypothetical protein
MDMPFPAPQDVEEDVWTAWMEIRKRQKCPINTDGAYRVVCRTLLKLKCQGNDPNEVVEQSVLRGWRGLFPMTMTGNKYGNPLAGPRGKPKAEAIERANRRVQ